MATRNRRKKKRKLPQWLDHFNVKDLKILFKTSLAVWIMTILIFIDKTLRVIGQATFFGCIVLFIVPPSGVVFVNVLAGLTIVIGLALGWAWGVITMKAALATRPQADLDARYTELSQLASQNATNVGQASGQTTYAQIAIFDGFMLDTRVTITYFCMLCLFIYLMARVRAAAPKLALVSIFAIIVADIHLVISPLIPSFQGTIPKVMILPVAIAVGIGVVCNLFFFPQSTSHIVLDGMHDVLTQMRAFCEALNWHFEHPESKLYLRRLLEVRDNILAGYNAVDASVKFLPMDFAIGKWGPEDITSLVEPFRQVFVSFGELLQIPTFIEEGRIKSDKLNDAVDALAQNRRLDNNESGVAYHQIAKSINLREHTRHPDTDKMTTQTLEALSSCLAPLLSAWNEAFELVDQALTGSSNLKHEEQLRLCEETLQSLRAIQAEFELSAGERITGLYAHLFDAHGNVIFDKPGHHPPFFGLMTGLLYQERIINLSRTTLKFLEQIVEIEKKRPRRRVWFPKGIQRIFLWGLSADEQPPTVQSLQRTTTATSTRKTTKRKSWKKRAKKSEDEDKDTAAVRLEEMRKPTGRRRHRSSAIFLSVIQWFTNDEGLHALRTLIVTIALAVPAVIRTSAGFYYREKGLWALIMGQLSLLPYASDFTSSLIVRTIGTILGGVVGMACWYIGSGSGSGNPYGLAAVMAVIIVASMWWRLFAPPDQMQAAIITISTIYLVVAYSWIDTHIPSYGNPGVGYRIFWRRLLLVLIGFGASIIVTFFPRPPSGNRHYRQLLSDQLSNIKDRYALFVSTWQSPPDDLVSVTEKEAIESEELLTSIAEPIKLTKFEFSTSQIDTKTLSTACHLCTNLNISITQLILYTQKLPPPQRAEFIHSTGATDESLIADLMSVLTLVQQSLESGSPLPAVLPTPLIARVLMKTPDTDHENGKEDVMRHLVSEDGRRRVSALNAYMRLLAIVDDLVMVLKTVVGEQHHVGLSHFDQEKAPYASV